MKKMIAGLLVCSILFGSYGTAAVASEIKTEEMYSITEPYEYPVLPGTDGWKDLNSLDEKIVACHVPAEILLRKLLKSRI